MKVESARMSDTYTYCKRSLVGNAFSTQAEATDYQARFAEILQDRLAKKKGGMAEE